MSSNNKIKSSNYLIEKQLNLPELLEKARLAQSKGDYKQAIFLLEMILVSKEVDLNHKIVSYAILSFIYVKIGRLDFTRIIANKFIKKYYDSVFAAEDVSSENQKLFLKVLLRAAQEEEKKIDSSDLQSDGYFYLSCFMYWKANTYKNRVDNKDGIESLLNSIKDSYDLSMENIKKRVSRLFI